MNGGLVALMGIGTVFLGLICIIGLITLLGKFLGKDEEPTVPVRPQKSTAPVTTSRETSMPKKEELIAVISAVLSEEMGVSTSHFKITSIRKI